MQTKHFSLDRDGIPYLIAEIGLNHNGSEELAVKMIESAASAGAHCVKFQLYDAALFFDGTAPLGDGPPGSLREFFRQFELPKDAWHRLAAVADRLGVDFLCSVFDAESLRLYRELNPAFVKIASTDLTNLLLIDEAKRMGFGLMLSTGASNEEEVARAVSRAGRPAMLFQCVSNYPAQPADYNLSLLPRWKDAFGCEVGLSDHCEDITVAVGSFLLGATAIERHFTMDRGLPGPDQRISSTPEEIRRLRTQLEIVRAARGDGVKVCVKTEDGVRKFGRRALYYRNDMRNGDVLDRNDLLPLRPGGGIEVDRFEEFLGRPLRRDVQAGQRIEESDF